MATPSSDWLPLFLRPKRLSGVKSQRYVDGFEIEDQARYNHVALQHVEDFEGDSFTKIRYATQIVGGGPPTVAVAAGYEGGAVLCTLVANADSAQAGVDWGDIVTIDLQQKPIIEMRVRVVTLPTISASITWGLCVANGADPDAAALSHVWFRIEHDGALAVTVESDDTNAAHDTTEIATGFTAVQNAWAIYDIDVREPRDCKFYINGVRVALATTFNINQVATLQMQPTVSACHLAADNSLGAVACDYIKIWQNRE